VGVAARTIAAIALPIAVGWIVTRDLRRFRCLPMDPLHLLWSARGVALACSICIAVLLLSGARISPRR
jgi:hypothetical protein